MKSILFGSSAIAVAGALSLVACNRDTTPTSVEPGRESSAATEPGVNTAPERAAAAAEQAAGWNEDMAAQRSPEELMPDEPLGEDEADDKDEHGNLSHGENVQRDKAQGTTPRDGSDSRSCAGAADSCPPTAPRP